MNLDMQNDDYKDNFKLLLYKQKGQTMQFGRKNNPFCPYIREHISNFLNKSVRTNIYVKVYKTKNANHVKKICII